MFVSFLKGGGEVVETPNLGSKGSGFEFRLTVHRKVVGVYIIIWFRLSVCMYVSGQDGGQGGRAVTSSLVRIYILSGHPSLLPSTTQIKCIHIWILLSVLIFKRTLC